MRGQKSEDESESERERRKALVSNGLFPKCPQWPELGHAETENREQNPGLLCEWQELFLEPSSLSTANLLNLGTLIRDTQYLNQVLTTKPDTHSSMNFLSPCVCV